jgi:AhpD family alkylhydroperoxidase
MLTRDAMALLENPPAGYPLIAAASAAYKRCGTCAAKHQKISDLLRIAVIKYMHDPGFLDACRKLFPLPSAICGILLK